MNPTARRLVLAALLSALSSLPAQAGPPFDAPYRYFPTSGAVHSVAAGRLGPDATVSAVVSHPDQRTLEVLAANTSGELDPLSIIPIGNRPHGVAIADFDLDGCPDVASGGFDPPGIALLRGRCGGRFDAPTLIATSTSVDGIAVADLDADGFPDLVGWSTEGGIVLLNDGSGGFRAPIVFPGSYSGPIAVGRLDPDPYPDLVVVGSGSVTIRYGRGDGTFGNDRVFPVLYNVRYPASPSLGDLDGDGDLDLVLNGWEGSLGGTIPVMYNDGQGNFPTHSVYDTESDQGNVVFTAIGDFDGDHHPDVIFLSAPRMGAVLGLLTLSETGGLRGRFERDVESLGPGAVADMNLDGRDDFLQADGAGVSLFMGSSTGRFGPTPLVGGFFGYGTLFAAHLDDGPTVDLAVSEYDDRFSLAFGNGDGTFRLNEYDFGGHTLVSADLDLDGHTDLVVSRNSTSIALGGGDGSFTPGQALGLAGPAGVMRIDADAYPDLLVATSDSLLAWRNRGDATFEPWAEWRGGGSRLITRDLNGDGRDDVVMQRAGSLLVVRLGGNAGPARRGPARGRRARSLGAETVYETAAEISDVQLADLDGDGHLDLVAEHRTVPPEWLRGRGDGTFDAPVALALPPAERLRFADWNGDGKSDAASLAGKVAISFGTGGASFTAPIWLGMGYNGAVTVPTDLAVGDFDGDGRPDVAVLRAHAWPDDLINYVEFMFDRIEPLVVVGGARPSPARALLIGRSGPNPMRSVTRFRFSPGAAQRVSVCVLDIAGREVRTLFQGPARRGDQEIVWDGRDARGSRVAPGIYLLNVRTESTSGTRRVVVLN